MKRIALLALALAIPVFATWSTPADAAIVVMVSRPTLVIRTSPVYEQPTYAQPTEVQPAPGYCAPVAYGRVERERSMPDRYGRMEQVRYVRDRYGRLVQVSYMAAPVDRDHFEQRQDHGRGRWGRRDRDDRD